MKEFHFESELPPLGKLLAGEVVSMNSLVSSLPEDEELVPKRRNRAEGPASSRMSYCVDLASPEVTILHKASLGYQVPIEHVSPADRRLFVTQPTVIGGVSSAVERLVGKPGMEAVNQYVE
jgi:hypothetical protein